MNIEKLIKILSQFPKTTEVLLRNRDDFYEIKNIENDVGQVFHKFKGNKEIYVSCGNTEFMKNWLDKPRKCIILNPK